MKSVLYLYYKHSRDSACNTLGAFKVRSDNLTPGACTYTIFSFCQLKNVISLTSFWDFFMSLLGCVELFSLTIVTRKAKHMSEMCLQYVCPDVARVSF